ncbi:hypothetical protein [Nocardia asteroides]|uniref:hypothetical protein n=1 Tax=Nocardia asteroides TaxID=1824 RepID=UPI001E555115|nr:hypothetical protein [Nocardia asteroides]UGT64431.1 hypothetical protein LTT61_14570 [Nocardia asteroides]
MSKTHRPNYRREARGRRRSTRIEHNITVRSVMRTPPDVAKLGRAVIALAMAELEAEKQADATTSADATSATAATPAPNEAKSTEVDHDD